MGTLPRQAVILAGGLGTRLRSVVADLPKSMAEINGRPFLEHQIYLLRTQGISDFVLCVGYMAEKISGYFGDGSRWNLRIRYSMEQQPMGTGGAIKLAEPLFDEVFVLLNGDTFLDCDLKALLDQHAQSRADVTMVVCSVEDATRFGTVVTGETGMVTGFREKEMAEGPGYANAGMYVLCRTLLTTIPANRPVSLERELLPEWIVTRKVMAFVHRGVFVDIGTPEGYTEFARRLCRC